MLHITSVTKGREQYECSALVMSKLSDVTEEVLKTYFASTIPSKDREIVVALNRTKIGAVINTHGVDDTVVRWFFVIRDGKIRKAYMDKYYDDQSVACTEQDMPYCDNKLLTDLKLSASRETKDFITLFDDKGVAIPSSVEVYYLRKYILPTTSIAGYMENDIEWM